MLKKKCKLVNKKKKIEKYIVEKESAEW